MTISAEKRNGRLTGIFQVSVVREGKRQFARVKTMAEAREIERQMKYGQWKPAEAEAKPYVSLDALYLDSKINRPRLKNSARAATEIEYCISLLGKDINVEDITSKRLTELAKQIVKNRGCSNATANRYVFALMGLLTWGRSVDMVQRAPVFTRLDEGTTSRTRWLTPEQEALVRAQLLAWNRPAEALCVEALALTGMRAGELLRLKPDQVDARRGLVTLLDQKDGTGEEGIPVPPALALRLREALTAKGLPTNNVLLKWFKKAAKAVGLPVGRGRGRDGLVVHSLRHSTATRLIQNKVNPAEVQAYMRHKSWATTQKYVKIIGSQKQAALEVLENASLSSHAQCASMRVKNDETGATDANAGKKSEVFQGLGAQGRNRTTDTAIFSQYPYRVTYVSKP